MKIAAITDDGKTISQHFGRAANYLVLTVDNGSITSREVRSKLGHSSFQGDPHEETDSQGRHGFGPEAHSRHSQMAGPISDCQALLAGGMGWGAYESLKQLGIEAVVTDVEDAEDAAKRFAAGNLPNLMDRLH